MEKSKVVEECVAKGAVVLKDLVIDDVCLNDKGDIVNDFVTITVSSSDVPSYDKDFKDVKTDKFVISLISLIGGIADSIKPSIKRHIKANPTCIEDLLVDATISLMVIATKENDVYKNPFSEDAKECVIKKKKMNFYNIVDVEFSKDGKQLMKEIKMIRNFGAGILSNL